jgi:hypothetical protein
LALGRIRQITESEDIGTSRSREKANTMAANITTPRSTATRLMRAWIIGGLGALVLLVVFMLHTTAPAAASATAARPCATSATPCAKCTHCAKCTTCHKCTKCGTGARCKCAA